MSEMDLDPYATLGVPRGASERQVREAYRRLAKRHHPDLHPHGEADERMRRINQAWQILSSPTLRARHDAQSNRMGSASAGHWAGATRSSTGWSGARAYAPPRSAPPVEDVGPAWPSLMLVVGIGVILVVASVVGIVPFPLFGIALVVIARGLLGRFTEGR